MDSTFANECFRIGCDISESGWPDHFGENIYRNILAIDSAEEPIRVLSLFSGAGGLDIGFHDAGFSIIESVEIEKKFCATLERNSGKGRFFEQAKVNCLDIRNFHPDYNHIDFIIGGPPCQTFSAAGRRANGVLGTTDARGILFREYARLLRELSPDGFLFENVYGIVGAQKGEPWREILNYFSKAGYTLFYRILDAADYGAPQHRERLIIVGLKEGSYKFPRPLFGPDSMDHLPFYSAASAIATAPVDSEGVPPAIGGRYGELIPAIPPGLNYSFYTEKIGNPKAIFAWRSKFSDFMYKADPDTPVRTIKAQGGQYTGPFHWDNRHFSVPEYKRLQTFPDTYEIVGGRQVQIQQIGNSVPPQLSRILALSIREQVFNRQTPISLQTLEPDEKLSFRKRKSKLSAVYRAKAHKALGMHNPKTTMHFKHQDYFALLDKSFDFQKVSAENADYAVSISPQNETLTVSVTELGGDSSRLIHFEVNVTSTSTWDMPFSNIKGIATGNKDITLTVLWKAIENALTEAEAKADLVQLGGYYQYSPQIDCSLVIKGQCKFPEVLHSITTGKASRKMISESSLCEDLGIEVQQMVDVAEWLRSLGYEIRNNNTNPQIPKGFWLIPYEYPTLTPLSVQLRKQV